MADVEREPCPRCGEPTALAARICLHCRGSALVDLRFDGPPADQRKRYQTARVLGALALPGLTFASAQIALTSSSSLLAAGLTREAARRVLAILAEQGLRGRELPAAEVPPAPSPPTSPARPKTRRLMPALLALAIAGLALTTLVLRWNEWQRRARPGAGDAPAVRPAAPAALTTRQIAASATPSAVSVRCSTSLGAGFFVTEDLVLTNAHVTCPGETLVHVVFADGRRLAAEIVRRDEWLDLAVLRAVGARAPALSLGDATALGAGDKVVMIGSPRGLDFTVHEGTVSHAGRNNYGLAYVQIDANVNPGNSGGPLLDGQGRVVGVVSMMVARSSGLGMALPINYAYDGEKPFVGRPVPGPDVAAWQKLLAGVAEADEREVREVAEGFVNAPGLVEAVRYGKDGVSGIAIRRFTRGSAPSTFQNLFRIEQGGKFLCSLPGKFQEWRSMDALAEQRKEDSRYFLWLKRNRLTEDLWVGAAPIGGLSQQCPALDSHRPFELVLEKADPRADRVVVDFSRAGESGP